MKLSFASNRLYLFIVQLLRPFGLRQLREIGLLQFRTSSSRSRQLALGTWRWTGRELQSRSRRLASWSAGCGARVGDSAADRHSTAEIEAKKGEGFGFVLIFDLNEYGLIGNLE
ncbi:Hypothetical predicted protein [Olea europaea subsp. europaea]|uniref:Uncharacterized protein n=1 Tax=Olea europaea subsp. europaea TaxID=158383 RepID=A0A8S0T3F0_OLEEU|nr:Hypothetical predicted protein [Olea europaea subsp. europaea]